MYDLVIKNARVITYDKEIYGGVCVQDEKIVKVFEGDLTVASKEEINANGKFLLPGGVDAHVHIRFPDGKNREDFYTGSCSAAAGGTTTIIEHPISSPPQYNVDILENRRYFVEQDAVVDVAFLGAAGGGNVIEHSSLKSAGIVGFKTFLHQAPEGRAKEFEGLTSENNHELMEVMQSVKKTNLMLSAHTEDNTIVQHGIKKMREKGTVYNLDHAKSRTAIAEVLSVSNLLTMANYIGIRTYLVHISSPEALEIARKTKEEGQAVYIETCPHYLFFDESYLNRFGGLAKCNPPLREKAQVEKMWEYIKDGTIDVIASDHAPYRIDEKEPDDNRDIFSIPAGFPGLETRIPLMMMAVKKDILSMVQLARLLSSNPADIFKLPSKGRIEVGYDADFFMINMEKDVLFSHKTLKTKSKRVCKFLDGLLLGGEITHTILRGKVIYKDHKILVKQGYGKNIIL